MKIVTVTIENKNYETKILVQSFNDKKVVLT